MVLCLNSKHSLGSQNWFELFRLVNNFVAIHSLLAVYEGPLLRLLVGDDWLLQILSLIIKLIKVVHYIIYCLRKVLFKTEHFAHLGFCQYFVIIFKLCHPSPFLYSSFCISFTKMDKFILCQFWRRIWDHHRSLRAINSHRLQIHHHYQLPTVIVYREKKYKLNEQHSLFSITNTSKHHSYAFCNKNFLVKIIQISQHSFFTKRIVNCWCFGI